MLALASPSTVSPTLLAALARVLASERPFAARVNDMFQLLRQAVQFDDARLVCWVGTGSMHEHYETPEVWRVTWNNELTDQALRQQTLVCVTEINANTAERGDAEIGLSVWSVPIVWASQTWGVLELRAANAQAVNADGQALLGALTPLLAAAIAGKGNEPTYAIEPARPHELTPLQTSLLSELRAELEAPLGLQELLGVVLRWALDSTGAEAGAISMVDSERGELVLQVYEGYPNEPFTRNLDGEPRRRGSWHAGLTGKVARTGRALLVRDVTHEPDAAPVMPEIRAELAAPIAFGGHTLAVIALDSPRSAAFGEREFAFVQALCAAATQPLRRALYYQQSVETSTQLGQVFSSIPSGLALLDTQGRVLRHNPAWFTVWGLEDDTNGEPFHVPWDLVPRLLARLSDPLSLSEFCASGQANPADVQTTMILLREPHQELHVLSVPTRDSLGQLTGRLWVVSDMTREREADRLKTEFISIVSHELRTPLTSILGYTELLMAREFTRDERQEFVKTIYDQANHLSQIIEGLLGISRLEAGKVGLNQWVVSLRQLVNELVPQLAHLSTRHRIVIHIPSRLPPAHVDRDKVKQVLVNLLTNAIKYSPRGGEVALAISEVTQAELPPDHPEGEFLLVSVRDSGIGIAPEDLPHIWERFYRVDNTNTRRIGGTGIGLAITKALVDLHGGRIWAESVVGHGSNFLFTLPIATEALQRSSA